MTERELQSLIAEGEGFFIELGSGNDFKREIDSAIDIAAEVVAFANTEVGHFLLIGVDDDGGRREEDFPRYSVRGVDDADSFFSLVWFKLTQSSLIIPVYQPTKQSGGES